MYYYLFFFFPTILPSLGKQRPKNFHKQQWIEAPPIIYDEYIEPANVRSTHGHTWLQLHRWHLILRHEAQFALPYQVISRATLITERRITEAGSRNKKREPARINTNYQDLQRETGLKMWLKCRNRELNERYLVLPTSSSSIF